MFHHRTKVGLATLATSLLILAAAPANARDLTVIAEPTIDQQLSQRVSYSDLNLATAAGQKRLHSRVRSAVRTVCAPVDAKGDLSAAFDCSSFAWNGAKPQIEQAVTRAEQLAFNGTTTLAPVAIAITGR
jgi:UrcA family protein